MQPRPNIALVPVEHDLDVTTVDALRAVIDGLLDDGCRRIVLNMSGVEYVDSAGMALLLGEVRRMRQLHGLLSLINVSDRVLAILKRARLVDFVPVSRSADLPLKDEQKPPASPLWRTAVPINSSDLSCTRASVEQLLEQVPLSPDERFDATLAVGEAMGNAVDHTDCDDALVTVSGYRDRVVIDVTDNGPGFDPQTATTKRAKDCGAERGRGIRMMRLLADSVSITPRSSGTGTLVRIVKVAHEASDTLEA